MALNKEVCIRCCKSNWPAAWADAHNKLDDLVVWGTDDRDLWNIGEVICPIIGLDDWPHTDIKSDPPSYCLCKFEQAVAAGRNK